MNDDCANWAVLSGSSAVLRSVLLPDLFGVEMIADRLGILNFFNGCSALVGLPITGKDPVLLLHFILQKSVIVSLYV